MAFSKNYTVKDLQGRQIWIGRGERPATFALKKTKKCSSKWTTTATAWYGDMDRAKMLMSKQYGTEITLVEDGMVEYFGVM